jgi:precorrin isomerase
MTNKLSEPIVANVSAHTLTFKTPNAPLRPRVVATGDPDVLLVLPWHFKKEFIEREHEFLKNGGTIVFPLPNLEIVKHTP